MPNTTILIVSANKQEAITTEQILRAGLRQLRPVIEHVTTQDEGRQRLAGPAQYDLLIVAPDLPEYERSSVLTGENRGLQLIALARQNDSRMPAIVVAAAVDSHLTSAVLKYDGVLVVAAGVNFSDDMIAAANRSLKSLTFPMSQRSLQIVFTAGDAREDHWTFDINGNGFGYQDQGRLELDSKMLTRLGNLSRRVAELKQSWMEQLRDVGEVLMEEIFSNTTFYKAFYKAFPYIDNRVEQLNIWFRIRHASTPIAFEALCSEKEFWMLRAPIYRRLVGYSCDQAALFSPNAPPCAEKLACLIIEADAFGRDETLTTEGDCPLELPKLSHLRSECGFLEQFLSKAKGVGEVKRILVTKGSKISMKQLVFEALSSQTWDIVHYAGHSYFQGDRGFLFFPPQQSGDFPEKMEIGEFAAHLTRTRFLYLSSCQSSEDSFILALARSNIASAVGYRWPVDDEHSAYCARAFYHHLFDDDVRSLQYAFLNARKDMHKEYSAHKIWASPVLLMQSN